MKAKKRIGICTLGCRVNQYESEAIEKKLSEYGFDICDFSEKNDVYIINTCTVTAESDRKSRQMIRRAIKTAPGAKVLVCGCYSQMFKYDVAKITGVDYISGTANKMDIVSAVLRLANEPKKKQTEICVSELDGIGFENMEAVCQGRTRAFLKIEDGCNNRCAYCIIPKARGRVRSKPIESVISEVKTLVSNGYKEIVLVGIETAAYGFGDGFGLIDLLEQLDDIDGLERIRLGSMDPSYLKDRVIDRLAKLKKAMPHYHLSLQSGTDSVLNAMRRRYNTEMVRRTVSYMRDKIPNVTFGADLIVGFPGESDEAFDSVIEFAKEIKILNTHVFSYSIRPGTEAAEMKCQIPSEKKEERSLLLRAVSDASKKQIIEAYISDKTEFDVLFEQEKDGFYTGHTGNFICVKVKNKTNICGQICKVVLKKYNEKDGMTEGELV